MNIFKMNEHMKHLYDVTNVKNGFDYWYFKLLNVVLGLFEYKNTPKGLPGREIEVNLIMTGHAMVIATEDGELRTPLTSLFGYDFYYQPTTGVFANPTYVTSKPYSIGEDAAIIYNNYLKDSIYYTKADTGLNSMVSRYARLLADIESTINIYTVNCRLTSYPVANDGSVKESLVQFFKNLSAGKRGIITDNSIIENFRNVDINRGTVKDGLNDLLIARDKILEEFYRDIGVKMHINKKAQMNEEEVSSDNQLLLISTDSMLKARREGIEMVNNMFGTDISVDINPLYRVEIERSESDAQTNGLSE